MANTVIHNLTELEMGVWYNDEDDLLVSFVSGGDDNSEEYISWVDCLSDVPNNKEMLLEGMNKWYADHNFPVKVVDVREASDECNYDWMFEAR